MQGHDTDRVKMDDRDYVCTCLQCKKTFEAKRSDATFCGAKCRVAYSREPQKRLNFLQFMKDTEYYLWQGQEKYKRDGEVFAAMTHLYHSLSLMVSEFEGREE